MARITSIYENTDDIYVVIRADGSTERREFPTPEMREFMSEAEEYGYDDGRSCWEEIAE